MGREQRGRGQYVLFLFTVCIALCLGGCFWKPPAPKPKGPKPEELALSRIPPLISKGDYKRAKELCLPLQKALSGEKQAEALYYLALLYADPQSPFFDPPQALALFQELKQTYPQGFWQATATVWLHLLKKNQALTETIKQCVTKRRQQEKKAICPLLLAQGKFQRALKVCQKQAQRARGQERAAFLYYLALLYADPQNPNRDLNKALEYFKEVEQKWPQTIWGLEARVWSDNIHALEELKRLNIELEKTKERIENR